MTAASGGVPDGQITPRPRRPLLVKKFGGTSVAGIERMREVARIALESRHAGNDVVVVVSAMSGETNRLLGLAQTVDALPDARELDVLAATGEQVSCALTAMCIHAQGGKASSFLGYQVPLITDDAFTKARIQKVERGRIRRALSDGRIPVVAGFQGVDGLQNITTLGRGGSDTTAVAIAAALGADACEIYTDVDGVYTANPRVAPSARKLSYVPYEEMLELASLGANVLQVRSVEIAMKYSVPVHVRSSFSSEEGTWITDRDRGMEARALTGLACARAQVRVELAGLPARPTAVADLTSLLADLNVSADMLGHSRGAGEAARTDLAFTLSESELPRARAALERAMSGMGGGELRVSGRLAKVSLVGIGVRSDPGVAAYLCRSLVRHGIPVSGLMVSELRISCLVDDTHADRAVGLLHDAFGLAQGAAPSL